MVQPWKRPITSFHLCQSVMITQKTWMIWLGISYDSKKEPIGKNTEESTLIHLVLTAKSSYSTVDSWHSQNTLQ